MDHKMCFLSIMVEQHPKLLSKQPIFWRFFQCSPRTQPTFGGEVGMRTRAAWFVGIRRRCWSLGNWTWAVSKSRGATMVKGTRISWTEKNTCYKMPQAYAGGPCGWIYIYIINIRNTIKWIWVNKENPQITLNLREGSRKLDYHLQGSASSEICETISREKTHVHTGRL